MITSRARELKAFLADVPDDYQVWGTGGDIFAAPVESRDRFRVFRGQMPDPTATESELKEMARIAVADFDCPF
jgi:hypothetical protein